MVGSDCTAAGSSSTVSPRVSLSCSHLITCSLKVSSVTTVINLIIIINYSIKMIIYISIIVIVYTHTMITILIIIITSIIKSLSSSTSIASLSISLSNTLIKASMSPTAGM